MPASHLPSPLNSGTQSTDHAEKFSDPDFTADGEPRAKVTLSRLDTLWFNTGTLCNLECVGCYIESSPRNDRLVYLTAAEVADYVDEIERTSLNTREIGFTGGEPFMNPQIIEMIGDCLGRGLEVLVLTNGMRPMIKRAPELLDLRQPYGDKLTLRVSVDHYTQARHEELRGPHSWAPTLDGLKWLSVNGFRIHVAGRTFWDEVEGKVRAGYERLFAENDIDIDAHDPGATLLFPEMDETTPVQEITTSCWSVLNVDPNAMMCASSRMVVKHNGAARPTVQACTLLPYDPRFEMGTTLAEAMREPIALNHPHCAKFCVQGGGTCSVAGTSSTSPAT